MPSIRLDPPFQPSLRSDLTPAFLPVAKPVYLRYKTGEKTWEIRQASSRFSETHYPAGREVRVCNGYNPTNGYVKRLVARRVEAPDYWSLPIEIDEGAVLDRANLKEHASHYFDADKPVVAIELVEPPKKPTVPDEAHNIVVHMLPSNLLRAAGDLLERGWCRTGALAIDASGRPVEPIAREAVAWSINGSIERASYDMLADPEKERYAPGRIQAWQRAHSACCHVLGVATTLAWERSPERTDDEWRDVLAAAEVYAEDMQAKEAHAA